MRILLATLVYALSAACFAATSTPEQCAAQLLEGYRTGDYRKAMEVTDPAEIAAAAKDIRAIFRDTDPATPNPMRVGFFGPDMSSEAMAALSDADLLARFTQNYIELLGKRNSAAPIQVSAYTVLGHVDEPPDLAHVVARVTVRDQSLSVTAIRPFTMKKIAGEWRAQLDESAKALLAKLHKEQESRERTAPK